MNNHVNKKKFRLFLLLTGGPERNGVCIKYIVIQITIFGSHSHKSRTPLIYLLTIKTHTLFKHHYALRYRPNRYYNENIKIMNFFFL